MGMYCIGQVIKRTRESLEITQEELCDGICSVETLSRIENGKTTPNRRNFKLLMERMGKCGEKYFPFIHSDDISIMQEYEKIGRMFQKRQYEELDFVLKDFENKVDLSDNVNKQFIMRGYALNDYRLGRIDEEQKRERLINALLCTVPCFNDQSIAKGFYNRSEITIICNIAASYAEEGKLNKALHILIQLKEYFNNITLDIDEESVSYNLFLSNYSQTLGRNGNLEEALRIGEKGVRICMDTKMSGNLANFLYNVAYDLELLKDGGSTSKIRLIQAYYVSRLNCNYKQMEHIKKHWKQVYEIPFII